MAYDEDLANRLRELLADEDAITEKKMFGGLAFLLHGNMSVSASRNGGLLARIDPADTDAALARPHVALMEMGGRTMDGWITVTPEGSKTKRDLSAWVKRSVKLRQDAAGEIALRRDRRRARRRALAPTPDWRARQSRRPPPRPPRA